MNVALLVCDDTPAYPELFRNLLDQVPAGREIVLYPYNAHEGRRPSDVHDYDAYLITGSRAGVYEDLPWIDPLLSLVRAAHRDAIPLVGVCFGHQVLAHALGGRAAKAEVGWELGIYETAITRRFPWMDNSNPVDRLQLIYVHQDQVTSLPEGATVFAATTLCPVAGFVLGNGTTGYATLGIQGHPEFTPSVTEEIIRSHPDKFPPALAEPALYSLQSTGESVDNTTVAGWICRFLLSARRQR